MSDQEPAEYILIVVDGKLQRYRVGGKLFDDMRLHEAMAYHYAAEADQLRAENERLRSLHKVRKPTGREVIEHYNRRHAQDPKVTLKEVCREAGVNYASIRALRSRYAKQKKPRRK